MTKVLDHGFIELVDSMPSGTGTDQWGPGDQRVVDAARVSIAGDEVRPVSKDAALLRYLLKNKHTTPFEQVRFTFRVKLPIFVARQWMRHRMGSFNEMSGRYGVLPSEFYVPDLGRMQVQATDNKQGSGGDLVEDPEHLRDVIQLGCELAYKDYERLLAAGLSRELARMVLPLNLYTQFVWTTDLHNLMHFLRLRLDSHAQYEVRVYAQAILDLIRPIAPCTVAAFLEAA